MQRSLITLSIALGLLPAAATAQVPADHFLVATYQYPAQHTGPGGLWIVHPLVPGPPTEITGLPSDLTGSGNSDRKGANAVVIHPDDGRIFTAPQGPPGAAIALHEITLSGTAVANDVSYALGVVKNNPAAEGGVYQMAWLPDGRLLAAVWQLDGALDGEHLILFDVDPGSPGYGSFTVVPIQNPPPAGLNALALDASGSTAYLGEWVGNQQGRIWTLPIPAGGTATLCAQTGGGTTNLAREANGSVFIATASAAVPLILLDPGPPSCSHQDVPTALGTLNGVDVELATGALACVTSLTTSAYRVMPGGQETLLTSGPPGGWGRPSGVCVNASDEVGVEYCHCASGAPCGNTDADAGCANSSGAGGVLTASGSRSAALDDLEFQAANLLPSQPALLFAGEIAVNGGAGIPFGDGLRCAGQGVVRLGVAMPDGQGDAAWGPGLGGGWVAGDVRFFQGWYRDPQGSPCGAGFNLTNAVEVTIAP